MTFRFLHLADLHLETRFGGRPAVRGRLREATRQALSRAVDLALERELHAVLLAGDAFDDELLGTRTEVCFVREVRRLVEAGIHVCYCCGNHDPGGKRLRAAGLGLTDLDAERVHLFAAAKPRPVLLHDRDGQPVGVVVGSGHVTAREDKNLAARFTRLESELPIVGLLHTQVEEALDADRHDRYAPCSRDDLARVDYDYWALGHVHVRQRPFPDVPAWYPGNLQGRNPRETGPKGGLLVELRAGEPAAPEFVPLAPVRWERVRVDDLAQARTPRELVDLLAVHLATEAHAGDEQLAAVLELSGPTPLAPLLRDEDRRRELEQELLDHGLDLGLAVEVQIDARGVTRPRDVDALRRTPCVLGAALALLEELEDPAQLARLAPEVLAGLDEGADADERAAYLRELAAELGEDLLERALVEDRR